ncbi:hypothetical protein LAZ67_5004451, partial [Cordylochernes scorpioides]
MLKETSRDQLYRSYKPYMERLPRQQEYKPRPSFLTEQSSRNWFNYAKSYWISMRPKRTLYFSNIVTGDDTSVYLYDPETKTQSLLWRHIPTHLRKQIRSVEVIQKGDGTCLLGQARCNTDWVSR